MLTSFGVRAVEPWFPCKHRPKTTETIFGKLYLRCTLNLRPEITKEEGFYDLYSIPPQVATKTFWSTLASNTTDEYMYTCQCCTFFLGPVEASASRQYSRIFWVGFLFRFLPSTGAFPANQRSNKTYAIKWHMNKYKHKQQESEKLLVTCVKVPSWKQINKMFLLVEIIWKVCPALVMH